MRSSLLFAVVFSLSRSPSTNAALVNRTIDDSNTDTISYVPPANWRSSSNASCSGCLEPNAQLAFQQTFHYGTHAAPPPDTDDQAVGNGSDNDHGDDDDDGSGSGKGDKGRSRDRDSRRLAKWRRADADDPNFVNDNVTATLTFIGSAFYVYCVIPVQNNNATTLSKTNLTFLLDGSRVGSYNHDPQTDTGSSAGFQYQVPVFSKTFLPYAQHSLIIKAEIGSMVLLDYVQYTTLDSTSSSSTDGGSSPAPTPSGAIDSQEQSGKSSSKNAATFGAAIGSSVGVLSLVALGVTISLCRRRRKSAKRQKQLEAQEEAARPSSPEMRGPQPFIPRYFPGTTVVPHSPSPPPFLPAPGDVEELGPSHGLNLPPAPGHTGHISPSLTIPQPTRIAVPVSPDEDDLAPPRYQDIGQLPLVSVPVFNHPLPPPGLPESPSSPLSFSGGGSPTSLTALSPRRPDSYPTVRIEEPTIHERPR